MHFTTLIHPFIAATHISFVTAALFAVECAYVNVCVLISDLAIMIYPRPPATRLSIDPEINPAIQHSRLALARPFPAMTFPRLPRSWVLLSWACLLA